MEFWLIQNNNKLRLPVPPESFEINTGNLNTTINVESIGEVNILGKSRLATITISSFFPSQQYYFCQYTSFPKPYECVALIKEMMKKEQVRLLITETNINNLFYIEDFTYGEKDGTGDIYFTIQFKEYRQLIASTKVISTVASKTVASKPPVRPVPPKRAVPPKPKKAPTYTKVQVKVNKKPTTKVVRNYSVEEVKKFRSDINKRRAFADL